MKLCPHENRVMYDETLFPPEGYELDFAICTTYSLDIQALISVMLSLGISKSMAEESIQDPISLLDIIQKVKDKIIVFYDVTQLHVPKKYMETLVLFENMLCPVKMSKKGEYIPSFHPKMWLIQYKNIKNKKEFLYRFVILSKNLTFDKSWDIVFSMDGTSSNVESEQNKPLINFISNIHRESNNTIKSNEISSLLKCMKKVNFNIDNNFNYIPIIPTKHGSTKLEEYILKEDSYNNILIISPFISDEIIKYFNEKSDNCCLITRKESLKNIDFDQYASFEDNVYIMKDYVVNGASEISDGETIYDTYSKQDIHAKIYLLKKGRKSYLYFGSANATSSAFKNNYEILFGIEAGKKLYDNIYNSLIFDDASCPFEKYENVDSEYIDEIDNTESIVEQYLKEIITSDKKAKVISDNNKYSIKLNITIPIKPNNKIKAYIKPYYYQSYIEITNNKDIIFENIDNICHISTFFIIKVEMDDIVRERMIEISVENMPKDREKNIINNIICNKEALYKYISLIFRDSELNHIYSKYIADKNNNINKNGHKSIGIDTIPIYEFLLENIVNHPERVNELKRTIDALDNKDFITNEMTELIHTFEQVAYEWK